MAGARAPATRRQQQAAAHTHPPPPGPSLLDAHTCRVGRRYQAVVKKLCRLQNRRQGFRSAHRKQLRTFRRRDWGILRAESAGEGQTTSGLAATGQTCPLWAKGAAWRAITACMVLCSLRATISIGDGPFGGLEHACLLSLLPIGLDFLKELQHTVIATSDPQICCAQPAKPPPRVVNHRVQPLKQASGSKDKQAARADGRNADSRRLCGAGGDSGQHRYGLCLQAQGQRGTELQGGARPIGRSTAAWWRSQLPVMAPRWQQRLRSAPAHPPLRHRRLRCPCSLAGQAMGGGV